MLRNFMILKSIFVIEHDNLFFVGAIFNDDPDLVMFRYKEAKKLLSTRTSKMILRCRFQNVFWSLNVIDIFRINIDYCIV